MIPHQNSVGILVSPILVTCPAHRSFLHFAVLIIQCDQ